MLVLRRQEGELVYIDLPDGRTIYIKTFGLEKGRCRLGFDAPRDVLIGRAEAKRLRVEPEERDG